MCGGGSTAPRLRFGDYSILRCPCCGLQFTHPVPDPDTLARAYNSEYSVDFENYVSGRVGDDKLDMLDRLLPKRGRLLEIGASYGEWLRSARDRGWGGRRRRDLRGCREAWTGAARPRHRDRRCDRGARRPRLLRRDRHVARARAHRRPGGRRGASGGSPLRPGGVFALSVPNGDSLGSRIGGTWWHWMAPPFHLWYFTSASIRILLERNGFGDAQVEIRRGDGYDPLMNLAIAAAGHAAEARRAGSGARTPAPPRGVHERRVLRSQGVRSWPSE